MESDLSTAADNHAAAQAQALFDQGLSLHQQGNLLRAQETYQLALNAQPRHCDALHLLGLIAYQTGNPGRAVELIGQALEVNPTFALAYSNLGVALQDLQQHQAALDSFDRSIALQSDDAEAHSNRDVALRDLGRPLEALDSFERAIALNPGYAEACNNRGNALTDMNQHLAALESYDRAIALKPDYAEAYSNRGNVLRDLKRHEAALASLDKAIALKPGNADAHSNRGLVLQELMQLDAALECHDRAIALQPDNAAAWNNRAVVLGDLNRLDAALESYDRALALKPDYEFLHGIRLHTRMYVCDWAGADAGLAELIEKVRRNEKATPSFPFLAFTGSLPLQRKAAQIWVHDKHPESRVLGSIPRHSRREKIRIGYFSADYRGHAIAYLVAELFEQHDRDRFELSAFSFGPDSGDGMRKRIAASFDRFIDVRDKPDRDVALLSRNLGVDIAVDLTGFTQEGRVGIFSYRAAPLQVSYLGYPGTMGAPYFDYLVADHTLIPQASQQHYAEKIVRLPDSYQANDRKRAISDRIFSRNELGLPGTGFVFCCFNNNFKITPATFDGWMRILGQVEGSVLWLIEDNPTAAANLRKEAEVRGVSATRLIFAQRMPLEEHLARHRAADLFIDSLPYNAHTTASDALWAGLPVLTCMGEAFASRVAASLLNAIELHELVTTTQAEFEALAVELATNPEHLKQIRQKLEKNRLTTALFDTPRFARHIEAAYARMYERYHAGLAPDHIDVAP